MKDYKFTPIIVVKDKDGKIEITEEKLKEMLQDAYNNGYEDGKNSNPVVYPITTPITPISPTIPQPYWDWNKPYCGTTGTTGSGNLGDIKVEG